MNPENVTTSHETISFDSVLEQEWLTAGITPEEWCERQQIDRITEKLLAKGRTVKEIKAEWDTKTRAEIILEYSNLLGKDHPS